MQPLLLLLFGWLAVVDAAAPPDLALQIAVALIFCIALVALLYAIYACRM